MDFYGIGCLDCRCLFSLFYLLIYFVGSRKSVRSRLLYMPYNHICNCGAGRYVGSNGIYIQVLQFLCQITADCLRPCFNRFFAVIPCVIGLCKVLHEIFYPVGVLQAKFNDFFFMGRVLVDSRKIFIHSKAHACDKHHPQRNHGFLMCAYLNSTHLFFFDIFSRFLILLKHIFQVLSIVLLVLHRLSAVASNYCLGLHILSGRLHGTSDYFLHRYRRALHTNQRYRWNGKIPSPQLLPARVGDVG
ncbi:hypothetical protein QSU_3816 [Clostridioides difficile P38]|nr:hypothetical protein QSU_3816 [Clostridioides difficile P38]